jgi:hypothetical protein
MGISRMLFGIAVAIFLIGCGAAEAPLTNGGGVSLRIQNNSPMRVYEKGFSCFVGIVDAAGTISVPIRYAMAPRKGFADAVHLERRVQDPQFFATDGMILSYEGLSLPRFVLVGHRKADPLHAPGPWIVAKLDAATLPKDDRGNRTLNADSLLAAPTASVAEVEEVVKALEVARKRTSEISDKEP